MPELPRSLPHPVIRVVYRRTRSYASVYACVQLLHVYTFSRTCARERAGARARARAPRFLGGFLLAANNKLSGRPCVIGSEYNLRMDNRIALR